MSAANSSEINWRPVDWHEWASAAAGGANEAAEVERALAKISRRHNSGFVVDPLYTAERSVSFASGKRGSGIAEFRRGFAGLPVPLPFAVAVRNSIDAATELRRAQATLELGATSLELSPEATRLALGDSSLPASVGLRITSVDGAGSGMSVADAVVLSASNSLSLSLGLDPLSDWLRRGGSEDNVHSELRSAAEAVVASRGCAFPLRLSPSAVFESGGSVALGLGYTLASALEWFRVFEGLGGAPTAHGAAFEIDWRADSRFFTQLAAMRAMRMLWMRLVRECGGAASEPRVVVQLARRSQTRWDPAVNILRNSAAAFAAAVGGADHFVSVPHVAARGESSSAADRLAATGVQVLLKEAHLRRVLDPAGGSYWLESLTEQLAKEGWEAFRQIEREGGLLASIRDGALSQRIREQASEVRAKLAKRKQAVVGVSIFPFAGEAQPPAGTNRGADESPQGLAPFVDAHEFESLRDESAAHPDGRPVAFLATVGTMAAFMPRVDFVRNALSAGGFEVVGGEAPRDPEAVVEAFRESGASLAILCGSERDYNADAVDLLVALRESGAARLGIAGRPRDSGRPGDTGAVDFAAAGEMDALYLGANIADQIRDWAAVARPSANGGSQ